MTRPSRRRLRKAWAVRAGRRTGSLIMPVEIQRDAYLRKLIERQDNGSIKVVTGMRRSGKSYLLFNLFHRHLLESGFPADRIVRIALDDETSEPLLDRQALGEWVRRQVSKGGRHCIMLDEIQMVPGFEKVLNGLGRDPDLDIYVTGSNSRFLASDVLTEFRGRGDEVRVRPLSFSEYRPVHGGTDAEAWGDYVTYGGLPALLSRKTDEQKAAYLGGLIRRVYLDDIVERHGLRGDSIMENLLSVLASGMGSLTNPLKLARTFASNGMGNVSDKTLSTYLEHLADACLIQRAQRYDVKGKHYISSPYKYYFSDVGLRNSWLNFRQQEEAHLMENIVYNELLFRGFKVDVGVVELSERHEGGRRATCRYEVDFVCNKGSQRYYVQSAFALPDEAKRIQETRPLSALGDSFRKVVVSKDVSKAWHGDDGILFLNLYDFLMNADSLDW